MLVIIGLGCQEESILKNKDQFSWFFQWKTQFICTSSSSDTRNIAFNDFSRLPTVAILDDDVQMTSKLENNHFRGCAMQYFMENDSSFVLLAPLTPDILLFMFF